MLSWPKSSLNEKGEFKFLEKSGCIKSPKDWNSSDRSKIWLYNLHYFDDLNSVDAITRTEQHVKLVKRWIDDNPPMYGNGWEPYCLSLRLVNWIKWASRQDHVPEYILFSMSQQAEALESQLEFHILGNHLFANAKALIFVGTFLSGNDADKWLCKGLKILDREISEQFLADGGHFELSPMYHATLLWDICDLIQLARICRHPLLTDRQDQWKEILLRGISWMKAMAHPDENISFFNDAAFSIAPTLYNLLDYVSVLKVSNDNFIAQNKAILHLEDSGYIAIELDSKAKIILDVGQVGASYQPGHAHADTLSFELSLFGKRIFVNSGISQYGNNVERHRQRSTAAHNTVVINGVNSSEVWAGFRVARRAKPYELSIIESAGAVEVECSHDGYKRLKGKPVHKRKWHFKQRELLIEDIVIGNFQEALAYYHIHPDILIFSQDDGSYSLRLPEGNSAHLHVEGEETIELIPSTWHPEFGVSVPSSCLVVKLGTQAARLFVRW